jgi:hypothetical protein
VSQGGTPRTDAIEVMRQATPWTPGHRAEARSRGSGGTDWAVWFSPAELTEQLICARRPTAGHAQRHRGASLRHFMTRSVSST